jgi:hypothetical protein
MQAGTFFGEYICADNITSLSAVPPPSVWQVVVSLGGGIKVLAETEFPIAKANMGRCEVQHTP